MVVRLISDDIVDPRGEDTIEVRSVDNESEREVSCNEVESLRRVVSMGEDSDGIIVSTSLDKLPVKLLSISLVITSVLEV